MIFRAKASFPAHPALPTHTESRNNNNIQYFFNGFAPQGKKTVKGKCCRLAVNTSQTHFVKLYSMWWLLVVKRSEVSISKLNSFLNSPSGTCIQLHTQKLFIIIHSGSLYYKAIICSRVMCKEITMFIGQNFRL